MHGMEKRRLRDAAAHVDTLFQTFDTVTSIFLSAIFLVTGADKRGAVRRWKAANPFPLLRLRLRAASTSLPRRTA